MTENKSIKVCSKCKETKSISLFHPRKNSKCGVHSACIKCTKVRQQYARTYKNYKITSKQFSSFHSKFIKTSNCWEWQKQRLPKGYGIFSINCFQILAHRFSFFYHYGFLDKDLDVLHTCDNPSCVNPEHLFLGTNQDNVDDKVAKNRQRKGEGIPSAKLGTSDILQIRELFRNGANHGELAKMFNVTKGNVGMIVRKQTWKHLP
jgi:hypothetical protein